MATTGPPRTYDWRTPVRLHPYPTTNARSPSRGRSNRCLPSSGDLGTLPAAEHPFDPSGTPVPRRTGDAWPMTVNDEALTDRQREILDYIVRQQAERGYPPSVREIGEAVGLTSPSTVH